MFRYLLTLAVVATSLLGPMPCCCMFGAHHHEAHEAESVPACCCQTESPPRPNDGSPRFVAPHHRCRCDHSCASEPLALTKTESAGHEQVCSQPISSIEPLIAPSADVTSLSSFQSGSHYLTGQAKLRALRVMRC